MYSLDIVIGTAICVLIVAGIVGFLLGRRTTAGSQQARELETRLDQVTRDKQHFEDRVTEHFAETATRLNALTENYRAVHEHLAEGANTLCAGNPPVTVGRLDGNSDLDPDMLDVQPPRDYAPKASPSETGMLNEGFGLEKGDVAPPERASRERFSDTPRKDTNTQDIDNAGENRHDSLGSTGRTEGTGTSDASQRGRGNG